MNITGTANSYHLQPEETDTSIRTYTYTHIYLDTNSCAHTAKHASIHKHTNVE